MMELLAKLGARTHQLTVESANGAGPAGAGAAGGDLLVSLGGAVHRVSLAPLDAAGGYSALIDGRPVDVRLLPGGEGLRVGNREFAIEIDDARRFQLRHAAAAPAKGGSETIKSPMPGKVVAIPVAAGDTVSAGQTVAIVEAMKMQNELTAETGGRVREVRASAGQVVDSGETLLVIERGEP